MKILKEMFTQQKEGEATPAIMGVCSYFANRFHLDVLTIRITTVGTAYLFASTSRAILAYIAIGVILSISGESSKASRKIKLKDKNKVDSQHQIQNKDQTTEEDSLDFYHQPPKLSKVSVRQLDRKLRRLEKRQAKLESSITSGHLKMARDFRELGKRKAESV